MFDGSFLCLDSPPSNYSYQPHPGLEEVSFICSTTAERKPTSIATSTPSPSTSMNSTTTEHDYRFPRRPCDATPASAAASAQPQPPVPATGARIGDNSSSIFKAETGAPSSTTTSRNNANNNGTTNSKTIASERIKGPTTDLRDFLRPAQFSSFDQRMAASRGQSQLQTPEEMQKQDPLAIQIWRFFAHTKQNLPDQERMENLTWRMMHVNLRKQKQTNTAR